VLPSNIHEPEIGAPRASRKLSAAYCDIPAMQQRRCMAIGSEYFLGESDLRCKNKEESHRSDQCLSSPPPLQHWASAHRPSRRATAGYPMTAEACCRHITTRAGGTSAARPRREPHSSHHSRNLQGLATACTYSPAEGSPASRIPSLARTVRRPPVRAPRLAKCCKMTGLGRIALLTTTRIMEIVLNAGAGERRHSLLYRRSIAAGPRCRLSIESPAVTEADQVQCIPETET